MLGNAFDLMIEVPVVLKLLLISILEEKKKKPY